MHGRPPTGSGAAPRPGTRSGTSWGRGATSLGGPPKTGMGFSMPPSTAMMRPGTSARVPVTAMGERPLTQQGIGGMPKTGYGTSAGGGGGRAVQDRSYWMGEIKQRLAALNVEMNKIRSDMDVLERENANYVNLEKRATGLTDELRDLQGQLGDYNTLIDKLHTGADLEETQRAAKELAIKNNRDQEEIDTLFMGRQENERQIKSCEEQLAQEKDKASSRISELGPDAQAAWAQLEADNTRLLTDIAQQQTALTGAQAMQTQLERDLQQDPARQKTWSLQEKKRQQQTKLHDMAAADQAGAALDTKEAILEEIKKNNAEIANIERNLADLERTRQALAMQIQQLDSTVSEEKAAKFEELTRKDKEMTAFLADAPGLLQAEADRTKAVQAEIVALLAGLHDLSGTTLGTAADLQTMTGDLAEKEKELTNAERTQRHLDSERERLMGDLDRVHQLETKIDAERVALQKRVETLNAEMRSFDDVDRIQRELTAKHTALAAEVAQRRTTRRWTKQQLTMQTTRYELKKAQLQDNEAHRQLAALETKWKQLEANNAAAREFIADKTAEAEYSDVQHDVMALVGECLEQNVKMVGLAP
ncbi:hypothetical protein AMAG_13110 [Allomyces macrogynus ATCC 38327]|uniref:Uncharacterized protein n=1 Tax=Allomyces macrogynus (strain ATCC 38327) TaxID=578462 RepID=A0A0L0SZE7_ALLM3|nr:hypothetical protein AMAG_13110 [Allomyces macrogynus ATCC 38327]|eukprot:KNE67923.1 hypothetical protein AMAG_13110 [Allomyces macrogynus ATCC 38327]